MNEFLSCRPNLEVLELAPTVAFLRDVLEFQVDVEEEEIGLVLLHRDAVGVAVVRTSVPAVNETTACYIGVTGVEALHDRCRQLDAKVIAPMADHPWGQRDFVVEIPGRHKLAFGERIS